MSAVPSPRSRRSPLGAAGVVLALASASGACSSPEPAGSVTSSAVSTTSNGTGGDMAGSGGSLPDAGPDGGGRGGAGGASGPGGGGAGGGCEPPDAGPISDGSVPPLLSQTGLYTDIPSETLAPDVEPFEPKYVLWSDGAVKQRYVALPACAKIDTSDMDHWSLPVGTRFWKTFTVDGVRVETRLIERWGPGPDDFLFAAYEWKDDSSDADHVPLGVTNAKGTAHDIPATSNCKTCHTHLVERALGFSAIQLSHPGPGVTIGTLSAAGRLTAPAPAGFAVPGDAVESTALGYLHANCGNCHNDTGIVFNTLFAMRVLVAQATVQTTSTWLTAVNVPVEKFIHPGVTHRIAPGDTGSSCVYYRMSVRGTTQQMPPLATEIVDPTGLDAVGTWIAGLPP